MIGSPIFRLYFSWLSQSQIIFRKFPFFQDLSETSHLFMVLYDKCLQFVILVFNFKNSCFQVFFRIACEWSIFLGVFSLKFFKKIFITLMNALRETCKYSELFWSAFSRIRTEYGEIRSISPCSYPMRENVDQNNSEYGHLLCSDGYCSFLSTVHASSVNPCLLNVPF